MIAGPLQWKMFRRNNGRYSLAHLCDADNNTVCGWKYDSSDYTTIYYTDGQNSFVCEQCRDGQIGAGIARFSVELKS